ncbi:DUF2190 family protein [Shimia ponticola]|uniref:DUF2190 family protein n=1 Tax=Shimia ponticola TaxID=2582893 RepID=UPI0011BDAE6D|nr:DUF2190 family protein [Shimia ponticola]
MAKTLLQTGDVLTVTATDAMTSGKVYLVGKLVGMALNSAAIGETCDLRLTGVWKDQPKVEAQAWAQGATLYWDNTAENFTTTASGNTKAGHAWADAANPSTTGVVRLSQIA